MRISHNSLPGGARVGPRSHALPIYARESSLRLNEHLDPYNPVLTEFAQKSQAALERVTGDPAAAKSMSLQVLDNLRPQQASCFVPASSDVRQSTAERRPLSSGTWRRHGRPLDLRPDLRRRELQAPPHGPRRPEHGELGPQHERLAVLPPHGRHPLPRQPPRRLGPPKLPMVR
jgi:hypothetical protein